MDICLPLENTLACVIIIEKRQPGSCAPALSKSYITVKEAGYILLGFFHCPIRPMITSFTCIDDGYDQESKRNHQGKRLENGHNHHHPSREGSQVYRSVSWFLVYHKTFHFYSASTWKHIFYFWFLLHFSGYCAKVSFNDIHTCVEKK